MFKLLMAENTSNHAERPGVHGHAEEVAVEHFPCRWESPQSEHSQVYTYETQDCCTRRIKLREHAIFFGRDFIGLCKGVAASDDQNS